ncbi:MAG: hypothetical protein P1V97_29790 [Planctomycetota bacterium]|nr:hypothetical protein [Planctomycetota bacterium]
MFVNQQCPKSSSPFEPKWDGDAADIPWGYWISRIVLVGVALFLVAGVGLANLLETHCCSNDSSAIGSMRTISASQAIFLERNPLQRYGTLEELGEDNYVDEVLRAGAKQGFFFEVAQRTIEGEHQYWAKASPMMPGQTGERFYFTNESGVLFHSDRDFEPGFFEIGQLSPELRAFDR